MPSTIIRLGPVRNAVMEQEEEEEEEEEEGGGSSGL